MDKGKRKWIKGKFDSFQQKLRPPPRSNSLETVLESTPYKVAKLIVRALKVAAPALGPFQPLPEALDTILSLTDDLENNRKNAKKAEDNLQQFASQLSKVDELLDKETISTSQRDEIQQYIRDTQENISKSCIRRIIDTQSDKNMITEIRQALENGRQVVLIQLTMKQYLHVQNIQSMIEELLVRKSLHIVFNAEFTAAVAGRHGCTEGTRETLIQDSATWMAGDVPIFWMNGMAGTGKTTIAYSFCARFEKQLAASFFCSRTKEELTDAVRIIPTIASQIAFHYKEFAAALYISLQNRKAYGNSPLEHQFHQLLLNPASQCTLPDDLVIVWDGADECKDLKAVSQIVSLLLSYGDQLPFKLYISSRPELEILTHFERASSAEKHRQCVLHNIEMAFVQKDIYVYIKKFLDEIAEQRSIGNWPEENEIQILVERSAGLFIYAATVCQYLRNDHFDAKTTKECFTHIINLRTDLPHPGNKYDQLDLLYTDIVERAKPYLPEGLLETLAVMQTPLSPLALKSLLDCPHDVKTSLSYLSSVLSAPNRESPVTLFHASFVEFLLGIDRAQAYVEQPHQVVANKCFHLMKSSAGKTKPNAIEVLPLWMVYIYKYWIFHAATSSNMPQYNEIKKFGLFIPWSQYLKDTNEIYGIIYRLREFERSSEVTNETRLSCFYLRMHLRTLSEDISSQETPHSRPRVPWLACQQILAGHADTVWSIAFSMDGKRIVSGSGDKTIRVWNTASGKEEMNLGGHTELVGSVAFSPNDRFIVSGSNDRTIRIWHAETGREKNTLTGHSIGVLSVAFSPDSQSIVSGSIDGTVRIWDVETGKEVIKLEGEPWCVAFSPCGEWIASGSSDGTVRIWNAKTGKEERKLEGHSDVVFSVAFSPDGEWIASGSKDKTIRVWNVKTGEVRWTLEGHTDEVYSVAYSPSGKFIVSSSRYEDGTIRVWNVEIGREVVVLEVHTSSILSIAFSLDGKWIASGSEDFTIRLWDWEMVQEMFGVTGSD